MIIPCIDLQAGKAVQLVRGQRIALAIDDVLGLLDRFRKYPILHVIDLDAALGRGRNDRWVKLLCLRAKAKVRVGGGIRTAARAEKVLSWGAEKIIVGSAAFRQGKIAYNFLGQLMRRIGRKRLIIALDAKGTRIASDGWRRCLSMRPEDAISALEPYCSEFLSTFVDREGTMKGTNLAWFRRLRRVTRLPITAAGGICSKPEISALEKLSMHAAIGMALYTERLS